MAQGNNTKLQAHLDAAYRALLDDVAHQEGQDTLGLVVLDHLDNIGRVVSLAQHHRNAGDISGNQGHAQGADDRVGHEADAGFIGVGVAALNVLQALDDLSAHGGGKAGIQCLAQVLLVGDQALEHTHTGRQIAQGLYLHAGSGINGWEAVGSIRESNFLVCAILGDGFVDGAFGQAGNRIGTTVDQISQYTHLISSKHFEVLYQAAIRLNIRCN